MDEFLGVDIKWNQNGVLLSQRNIIRRLINVMGKELVGLCDYKIPAIPGEGIEPPGENDEIMSASEQILFRSSLGSLLYICRFTRPDLTNAVRELTKVTQKGSPSNYKQLLRLIKYLHSTKGRSLKIYPSSTDNHWRLCCYSDSDWDGDKEDRKSVSGWIIKLNGAVVCWGSRKQKLTSVSSTEAEYVAISEMCKEILFIKSVLEFIKKMSINLPILIFCDNEGAIYLSNNHERRHTNVNI